MNLSPLKTVHIRKTKASGSDVTIVYQVDYTNRRLSYSVARCSKKDTFVRKVGHHIALNRFIQGKIKSVCLDTGIGSDRYADIESDLRLITRQ